MINNVLTHRATVERAHEVFTDGTPATSWTVTAVRMPVLLSRGEALSDPTWTPSQRAEANAGALLIAQPSADIQPGDRVHLTRPDLGSYVVLADAAVVATLHDAHHAEYQVRSA